MPAPTHRHHILDSVYVLSVERLLDLPLAARLCLSPGLRTRGPTPRSRRSLRGLKRRVLPARSGLCVSLVRLEQPLIVGVCPMERGV